MIKLKDRKKAKKTMLKTRLNRVQFFWFFGVNFTDHCFDSPSIRVKIQKNSLNSHD